MTITVRHVEPAYVSQLWHHAKPFIDESLASSPHFPEWYANYNADHVQAFLVNGAWLLLLAVDENNVVHGAATVSFINYPMHRVAFITSIGGNLVSNAETFEQLKLICKQRGATKIQGYCRESVARLFKRYGFEPRNTLIETLL